MKRLSRRIAIVLLVAALSACTTSHSDGSRAEVYDSIEELAADSTIVVVVTATAEILTSKEPQLMTGTDVVVEQSLTPDGLTTTATDTPDRIVVWQLGDASSPGPLPYLKDGNRYLLFLVDTGLENLPGGYFIAGSSAGFWEEDGQGFTRPVDEGDRLPKSVTLVELKQS